MSRNRRIPLAADVSSWYGRLPNTQQIGLDTAGIELDARGHVKVNERLETTAPDLRTRTMSETGGFLKALIAMQNDQILGFTALGAGAGEVIAVVQMAMLAGIPYTVLRDTVLTHPTIAEGLTVLFANEPQPK